MCEYVSANRTFCSIFSTSIPRKKSNSFFIRLFLLLHIDVDTLFFGGKRRLLLLLYVLQCATHVTWNVYFPHGPILLYRDFSFTFYLLSSSLHLVAWFDFSFSIPLTYSSSSETKQTYTKQRCHTCITFRCEISSYRRYSFAYFLI